VTTGVGVEGFRNAFGTPRAKVNSIVAERNFRFNSAEWDFCRGPANWFRFRCPPGLTVTQNETIFELAPEAGTSWQQIAGAQSFDPSTDAAREAIHERSPLAASAGPQASLLICAAWVDEPEECGDAFDDVSVLFPQVAVVRPEPPLNVTGARCAWSGISSQPAPGSWLRRLFARRRTYQWRFWSLQHGSVLIAASIQSPNRRGLSAPIVAICEAVLNSLELAEDPCWPPEVFQRQVVSLGRQNFPLLSVNSASGFAVAIEESEISLSNFYRSYLQHPDQFSRIVLPGLTTVVRLRELGPDQILPSLENVRDRILPMLSCDEELRPEELVKTPWVGGLNVGYVLDEDDAYRFVHRKMLHHWNIDKADLHDIALENLQSYAQDHPLEVTMVGDEDDPQMLMPLNADAYNSSRILDPGFHGKLRELFGPQLVVGLPNRDFFVAVSLNDPTLVDQVRERVSRDHATMHHPLTERLLVISADGVSEFVEG